MCLLALSWGCTLIATTLHPSLHPMVRGSASTSTAWFAELFGFEESDSFSANQAKFAMENYELVCDTSPFPRQYVGPWETPSLQELRARIVTAPDAEGDGLRFEHIATPVGVVPLILDPANHGAVFQAASQFNALEMTGPGAPRTSSPAGQTTGAAPSSSPGPAA